MNSNCIWKRFKHLPRVRQATVSPQKKGTCESSLEETCLEDNIISKLYQRFIDIYMFKKGNIWLYSRGASSSIKMVQGACWRQTCTNCASEVVHQNKHTLLNKQNLSKCNMNCNFMWFHLMLPHIHKLAFFTFHTSCKIWGPDERNYCWSRLKRRSRFPFPIKRTYFRAFLYFCQKHIVIFSLMCGA